MPTSFQQNIKFTAKPEKMLEEFQFDGGLITDAHETKLKPNQSPDLANVVYNNTGSIKTRNGYISNIDPAQVSVNISNIVASTGSTTISASTGYVAQSFTVASNTVLSIADVYLSMVTSGQEQYVQLQLWSGSTGPVSLLATGQIKLISGTSETAYEFKFNTPHTLTASTEYCLVVVPFARGSAQSINSFKVYSTGNVYANGAAYSSTDTGVTWSAIAATDFKFIISTGASDGCTGLIRYYSTAGISQQFAKFGSSFYQTDDGSGGLTSKTLGSGVSFDTTAFLNWTIFNDTLLIVDGTNKIQKYRGSTNSNYSTGTITATNGSATITGSSTVWATSTNAEVGEYIQLPDTKWYKITAISSNTSLTIEVSYQGTTQSGQTYKISPWGEVQGQLNSTSAPSLLTVPIPNFITAHQNRVWTLDGNVLRFSTLDTSVTEECFNDWDTANNAGQINIPSNKGDNCTGMYSINGTLYIFQRNSIWALLGTSPATFELRSVSNEIGLIDRRTLVEYDAYVIFFSGKDVYIFDGTNLKNLSANRVNTAINDFANITSPVAVLWKSHYLLSYTPGGQTYNSEVLFYDIVNDIWGKFENVFASAWVNWDGGSDSNQVYFGSSNQGQIYQWDTGSHDDGYVIETRYSTPSISLGTHMSNKTIKRVYVQQIALGDWNESVYQYRDISDEIITSDINLSTGTVSLWDVAQWDVDEWSDTATLITTRVGDFQGTGKYFRYLFSQTGYSEGIEVLGLTITARERRLV